MNRILSLVLTVCLLGCGDDSSTGSDKEIDAYVDAIKEISGEESAILDAYASVTGDNYTDDASILAVLEDITRLLQP